MCAWNHMHHMEKVVHQPLKQQLTNYMKMSKYQHSIQNPNANQTLLITITDFPEKRDDTPPIIKEYWKVQNWLSTFDGAALTDNWIVIPTSFWKRIIQNLHSVHQGLNGMRNQARHTDYRQGMNNCLWNYQQTIKLHQASPNNQLRCLQTHIGDSSKYVQIFSSQGARFNYCG